MPLFLHPVKDFTFLILYLSSHLCEEQCLPHCGCDSGSRRGKPGYLRSWRGFNTAPQHHNSQTLRIVQSLSLAQSLCELSGLGLSQQLKPDERMWWDGDGRRGRCRGALAAR